MNIIKVAIVDDHSLILKALENMITEDKSFDVLFTANNGEKFLDVLKFSNDLPDVVLMDVNMPFKDGIETTEELSKLYPQIKVIALTMEDNEQTVIRMLKAGAKGYLLKDMEPAILFEALRTVYLKGAFYTDKVTQSLLKVKIDEENTKNILSELKEKELDFIKLACSEMTYKEIADKMCLSPKTIDGYRDSVFVKLDVKSRVGLVLFAVKNKISE